MARTRFHTIVLNECSEVCCQRPRSRGRVVARGVLRRAALAEGTAGQPRPLTSETTLPVELRPLRSHTAKVHRPGRSPSELAIRSSLPTARCLNDTLSNRGRTRWTVQYIELPSWRCWA